MAIDDIRLRDFFFPENETYSYVRKNIK
jgi:hypothetical protein